MKLLLVLELLPAFELAKAIRDEGTIKIRKFIAADRNLIDLQEPKFGRILLLLAVGNDKVLSTTTLLNPGTNISLRDLTDLQAIQEASQYTELRKHSYEILQLLIKHGAIVNARSKEGNLAPLEFATKHWRSAWWRWQFYGEWKQCLLGVQ